MLSTCGAMAMAMATEFIHTQTHTLFKHINDNVMMLKVKFILDCEHGKYTHSHASHIVVVVVCMHSRNKKKFYAIYLACYYLVPFILYRREISDYIPI